MCFFIFSFSNSLYLLLHQDEEMNALDQLRRRATKAIYIEPLASRLPPTFQENNKSSKEDKNIEKEIFEALKHANIMGEGLEETL